MIRQIDENLITPDKLLNANDMAKLGCNNCEGCTHCCKDRAVDIVLDSVDVRLLKDGLKLSFQELMAAKAITLKAVDGVILPVLPVSEEHGGCLFLDENGRCKIHKIRPGICRMFPLARLYHEDGSFSYFIQEGECAQPTGVKIKVEKWLGYDNIRAYEAEVRRYHDALSALKKQMKEAPESGAKRNTEFLTEWFLK